MKSGGNAWRTPDRFFFFFFFLPPSAVTPRKRGSPSSTKKNQEEKQRCRAISSKRRSHRWRNWRFRNKLGRHRLDELRGWRRLGLGTRIAPSSVFQGLNETGETGVYSFTSFPLLLVAKSYWNSLHLGEFLSILCARIRGDAFLTKFWHPPNFEWDRFLKSKFLSIFE